MSEEPTSSLNQVVRLVADPYPPYQFEERGLVKGSDYEIVTRALALSGVRTIIKLLPWDACLDAMRCGEAGAIFQITPTPEREHEFLFSKPFRTARTLFFKRADTG
jgi:polar amino acid transport system substrate-binding protein